MFEFIWMLDQKILKLLNLDLAHPYLDQFWRFLTSAHKHQLFMMIALPLLLNEANEGVRAERAIGLIVVSHLDQLLEAG